MDDYIRKRQRDGALTGRDLERSGVVLNKFNFRNVDFKTVKIRAVAERWEDRPPVMRPYGPWPNDEMVERRELIPTILDNTTVHIDGLPPGRWSVVFYITWPDGTEGMIGRTFNL